MDEKNHAILFLNKKEIRYGEQQNHIRRHKSIKSRGYYGRPKQSFQRNNYPFPILTNPKKSQLTEKYRKKKKQQCVLNESNHQKHQGHRIMNIYILSGEQKRKNMN